MYYLLKPVQDLRTGSHCTMWEVTYSSQVETGSE